MGSSGKPRTTFQKLNRESKLRDKRAEKEARKAARKLDAANEAEELGSAPEGLDESSSADPETRTPDRPDEIRAVLGVRSDAR